MNISWKATVTLLILALIGVSSSFLEGHTHRLEATAGKSKSSLSPFDRHILNNAAHMLEEGRRTFRFETFGDQDFWGDQLRLHEAIATVSPKAALRLGLKVDVAAVPAVLRDQLQQGRVDLDDPAVTLTLLQLNAVVGLTGFFRGHSLKSIGLQCALCHSTVDTSWRAPGILVGSIGQRLDGWANRDLNVGAIIALAPTIAPLTELLQIVHPTMTDVDVRNVLRSWGPGKFDAQLLLDGKAKNPQQISNGVVTSTKVTGATLIPPAFGLAGVNNHTWTGAWGTVPYWNALVANLEMHGQGTFFDPRLDNPVQFPIAAAKRFGHLQSTPDLITPTLPALHFYQLALPAPKPPPGSFDADAAERGKALFSDKATCARCHVEPITSEPGWNLHTGDEICIDTFQADRAPDQRYRTSPLNGLWTHQRGGFFHDGRFKTLLEVVNHYNTCFTLNLEEQEKQDLVQYLLSLPNEE